MTISTYRQWEITSELSDVRRHLRGHATRSGLGGERLDDLLVAVNEAASNVLEHGGGHGVVASWYDEAFLTVEIRDTAGELTSADTHRRRPARTATRGYGLWLMGQLCDHFTIHQQTGGSHVRLVMDLRAGAPHSWQACA
ncbi:ATP-binding protein [Nonomuraea sp. NPDC050556]|uniref:ATP-binding protein n=1 Tax=Nonomuraea sp. NPDC050556 TaxID=3364369 RepID=UPI0037A151A1